MPKLLTPIHPGEILREEVLRPLNLSVNQLAKLLAVDAARLNEIVRGRRGITADTALRLARYLGTSPEFVRAGEKWRHFSRCWPAPAAPAALA